MSTTIIASLDDGMMTAKKLKRVFADLDYEIYVTSSWPDLKSYLDQNEVKILLFNFNTYGVEEEEVWSTLKNNHPEIEVYVLSSEPEWQLSHKVRQHKAAGFLQKSSPPEAWVNQLVPTQKLGQQMMDDLFD